MQTLQEQISVHAPVGAKIIDSSREKSIILIAPRADAPTKHCIKGAEQLPDLFNLFPDYVRVSAIL